MLFYIIYVFACDTEYSKCCKQANFPYDMEWQIVRVLYLSELILNNLLIDILYIRIYYIINLYHPEIWDLKFPLPWHWLPDFNLAACRALVDPHKSIAVQCMHDKG
jgi:hypothetical protein